jgi:RNA 2',3'-cyclic 3'-phosphodiesterase
MQAGFKEISPSGRKRLFVAIRIDTSEKLHELLSSFRSELKEAKIKWSDPGNFHITVAFLGDTSETKIPSIGRLLEAACSEHKTFSLILSGAGVFRNSRDPRVIWAGLQPSGELERLFKTVSARLTEEGIKLEDRPFRPHLTLGRVKSIADTMTLDALVSRYSKKEIQVQQVNELILYESILQPSGPLYRSLGRYPLDHGPRL